MSHPAGAEPFDIATIAAFLHAPRPPAGHGKLSRPERRFALAITNLDADGVADDTAPSAGLPTRDQMSGQKSGEAATGRFMAFDTGLGQIKTAARAGTLNGEPAAAVNIGLTEGAIVLDAAGMTEMTNLSDPGGFRKTFKVSTSASIPLD